MRKVAQKFDLNFLDLVVGFGLMTEERDGQLGAALLRRAAAPSRFTVIPCLDEAITVVLRRERARRQRVGFGSPTLLSATPAVVPTSVREYRRDRVCSIDADW